MNKYLIVGLGNPGFRYKRTKHNMGFMVIDYLSQKLNMKVKKHRGKAIVGEGVIDHNKIILAKPQTYMNNSGQSIQELISYYDIKIENLIVIYDDMDLSLGRIRIRMKGSSGSHNGMKSIIYHIQDENFKRIRIGIGNKEAKNAKAHVLSRISKDEKVKAFEAIENGALALLEIINQGINSAMNRYNK